MRKALFITFAILMAGAIGFYIYLGGLNSVEISIENVDGYQIAGREFEGKANAKEIETYFFEAKGYVQSGQLKGVLTIIHYNDTTLDEDETKLFIGVTLDNFTDNLPRNYTLQTIDCDKAVRATIEAHNVVMPGPETIESNLKEEAVKNNLTLQDFTIEQYVSENQLIIDMPTK